MAVLDVIGATSQLQGTKLAYSFFNGESQTIVIKGERSVIKGLYDQYKIVAGFSPTYDSIDYDPGKGLATLTMSVIGDGETTYELMANEMSQHISTHSYFASLTDSEVAAVLQAVEAKQPSTFTGAQSDLYAHCIRGLDEYVVSNYVLRETKNVSKRSLLTASYTNVNQVDTPPDTQVANTLIGLVPSGEWLKKTPIVRQVGNRRWQIIQEWWWAEKWSRILYGGSYL